MESNEKLDTVCVIDDDDFDFDKMYGNLKDPELLKMAKDQIHIHLLDLESDIMNNTYRLSDNMEKRTFECLVYWVARNLRTYARMFIRINNLINVHYESRQIKSDI